jgi:hypothetical protein
VPVADPRAGSPAEQVRVSLARSRSAAVPFDAAWAAAYANVRWPHDTIHRLQWKAVIEADEHQWRAAYHFVPPATHAQVACAALVPA